MIAVVSPIEETLSVRRATVRDAPALSRIFAHYVTHTVTTFETTPPTAADWQRRIESVTAEGWPFLVGTVEDEVIGFAYVGAWRLKPAYRHTVESTVYLDAAHTGRGHGRRLVTELLSQARQAGAHMAIAVIADSGNPASVGLHRSIGFVRIGRLREVGYKHERWIDTELMQKQLTD